jgi:hypothetical protein
MSKPFNLKYNKKILWSQIFSLLLTFQTISKQNHFFEKKLFHFKRPFWFLDILKMSFFEKSPPDPKTTFFFRNFFK